MGILNSTLIGFFKTFYGRFAGTVGDQDRGDRCKPAFRIPPDPLGVVKICGSAAAVYAF